MMLFNRTGRRSLLPFALLLLSAFVQAQNVRINELMASNHSTITDGEGVHHDWIELYNGGVSPVSLAGMYISDDPGHPLKHQLPAGLSIPANGHLLLWASGEPAAGGARLGFTLPVEGAFVVLTGADGVTAVDQIQYGPQLTDVSYGRATDGDPEWLFFPAPTPGSSNNTSTGMNGFLQPPVFSVAGGFHPGPFQLNITSAEPGTTIIYSTDGTTPSMECLDGSPYTYKNQYPQSPGQGLGPLLQDIMTCQVHNEPIGITDISAQPDVLTRRTTTYANEHPQPYMPTSPVRKGMVIRARAFKSGHIPSEVVTHTYYITPGGVSPFQLPVLSLNTDRDLLFGYTNGIYTAGQIFDNWRLITPDDDPHGLTPANWHTATEVPVGMEWIEPGSAAPAFRLNAGMRMHGGFSRSLKRKSLRLYFRSLYGTSELAHEIFPDQTGGGHKRLIVHNSGNDEASTNLRDMTLQAMMGHMRNETMDARPANLFLNGEYWGVHAMRERFDRHYLERKYAIRPGELDMLELRDLEVIEGDAAHYQAMMQYVATADMTQDAALDEMATRMDIDDFIDFQIAHIFTGNTDWPQNNVRMYRKRTPAHVQGAPHGHDGRWRWFLFDLDFGFNLAGNIPAGLQFLERASLESGFGLDPQYTLLLRKLLQNQSFRDRFINRAADMINTAFRAEVTTGIIDQHRDLIAGDMQEHFQRWRTGPGSVAAWQENLQVMYTFASARPGAFRTEIRNRFTLPAQHSLTLDVADPAGGYVHINSIDLLAATHGVDAPVYPWTGTYFQGVPVKLKAHAMPGYQFLHWTGDLQGTQQEIEVELTATTSITAVFGPAPWCAREMIHYWHFNALPSGTHASIPADQGSGGGAISYAGGGPGIMDRTSNTGGSPANAQEGIVAGRALRVRNPSSGRELIIRSPSTGYRDVELFFATMRSENGPSMQRVSYTTSSQQTEWTLMAPAYLVIGNYVVQRFELQGVEATNDAPHLAFKIEFLGPETGYNTGNSRFDNIVISGRPYTIIEEEFCEGDQFTYNGTTYDHPGRYPHEFAGPMDCGTHVLLYLAYPAIDTTVLWMPGGAIVASGADQYQWLDCDAGMTPVTGADSPQFEPTMAGNYAVRITVNGCTVLSSCHLIDPDQPTGITVYPNPVSDLLFVDVRGGFINAPFNLYDQAGRVVATGILSGSPARVDMSSMVPGVYTLEVRGREIMRQRLIR